MSTTTARKAAGPRTVLQLQADIECYERHLRKLRRWRDSAEMYIGTRSEADPKGAADARAEIDEYQVAIVGIQDCLEGARFRLMLAEPVQAAPYEQEVL